MNLSDTKKRFFAEIIGTFVVVVCATGSVVANAKSGGDISWFEAFAPFVGATLMIYAFGKISLAPFNPAITVAYFITKHITKAQLVVYFAAEAIGAFLAIFFVKFVIGSEANIGANAPNHSYSLLEIIGIEVLATALLMGVIMCVAHTKGLRGFDGIAIGGIIGLDIFFLSSISGASMNPIRALAPALISGVLSDLWIYCTAPFVGATIIAAIYKKKFVSSHTNT